MNLKAEIARSYVKAIPRELPDGMVLVHNHVRPARRIGTRGFRAWTSKLDDSLVVCPCDWAGADLHGLVHYRVRNRAGAATEEN
jgi:hypothetical protein